MRLYKLTKQDGTTHNGFPYAANGNEEYCLPEVASPKTCSSNVFHAYKSIELAFLLNPIHARIQDPRLWEIEGDVVVDRWDKVGSFKQKIVRELPIPSWVRDNSVKVRFAKMCADTARVAADAARADAANYSAYAAADTAYSANYSAYAAADAARAAAAADAARAEADADAARAADADTAYYAARAAAYAAYAAADARITIDIQKIAESAIKLQQTKKQCPHC